MTFNIPDRRVHTLNCIQDSENDLQQKPTTHRKELNKNLSEIEPNNMFIKPGRLKSENKISPDIPGHYFNKDTDYSLEFKYAPKANEISANLCETNILQGSRIRKPKKKIESAAIYIEPEDDYRISSGEPFFFMLSKCYYNRSPKR